MKKNNDNNSDLTLQICSNDSESLETKSFEGEPFEEESFEEESFEEESYEEELFDGGLPDTELLDSNRQFWSPIDFFSTRGELVINGGMEEFDCGVPECWRTKAPCAVSQVTAPGRVHSGNSCVGLSDCAKLSQVITTGIRAHRFYRLSFCAQLQGTNAGLAAEIIFLRGHKEIAGGSITVRGQDIPNCPRQFGYYTLITSQAPRGVTGAIIEFSVNTNGCQCVCIDDVSCEEQ